MKLINLLLCCFMLVSFVGYSQKIDSLIIYKKNLSGGSTTSLEYSFLHPKSTLERKVASNLDKDSFQKIMINAKKRKHFQTKIAGIIAIGEMNISNKKHFFVLLENSLLIDLTARKNYWINNKDKEVLRQILVW
jgi:hypothetical protein